MEVTITILQILLSVFFVLMGIMKFTQSKEKLIKWIGWPEDYSPARVKTIGVLELLGGLGVAAPLILNDFYVLTPIAATCLGIIMGGAIGVHIQREEPQHITLNLFFFLLAVIVGFERLFELPI